MQRAELIPGHEPFPLQLATWMRADGDDRAETAAVNLRDWAPGEKCQWIRTDPLETTGRWIYRRRSGAG